MLNFHLRSGTVFISQSATFGVIFLLQPERFLSDDNLLQLYTFLSLSYTSRLNFFGLDLQIIKNQSHHAPCVSEGSNNRKTFSAQHSVHVESSTSLSLFPSSIWLCTTSHYTARRAAEFIMQKAFSVYITRKHKVRSASPQKSTSQMSRTRLAQKIF
jgi:hypothetical protein